MSGALFIVATPIGNPADFSERAKDTLKMVDVIAVEDTRHSGRLLNTHGITTPMLSYHDYNEAQRVEALLSRVQRGENVALISDAGTPLISDPGYQLVREAYRLSLRVVPVPGPCAVIAALSCAGLATDRFVFEGFLPAREGARRQRLQELAPETRTLVFYEAPHRIVECLTDMVECFGRDREVTLAREITKTFETFIHSTLQALLERVVSDSDQQKGEIVLLLAGAPKVENNIDAEIQHTLRVLLEELPLKQAVALAARLTSIKKNQLYDLALSWQRAKE